MQQHLRKEWLDRGKRTCKIYNKKQWQVFYTAGTLEHRRVISVSSYCRANLVCSIVYTYYVVYGDCHAP